jgi:hypothetical protein
MTADLERLQAALTAKEPSEVRAVFRDAFDCRDSELDTLLGHVPDAGVEALFRTLDQIRRAPVYLRPTLSMALPFILTNDKFAARDGGALAAARAVVQRFPERPK